jgi:hypothetical protein
MRWRGWRQEARIAACAIIGGLTTDNFVIGLFVSLALLVATRPEPTETHA